MKAGRRAGKAGRSSKPSGGDKARFAAMIEEATVDAHDESEQATGWFAIFEE